MKYFPFIISLLITASCNKNYNALITLENPSDFDRGEELIVISADSLPGYDKKDNLIISVEKDSTQLPFQCDDIDLDGKWDELALMLNFKPKEEIIINIKSVDPSTKLEFEKRTNIRFAKIVQLNKEYQEVDNAARLKGYMTDSTKQYPQFEGPGWENDKVAFRNYFDERNGIDIFGKTTNRMVLDSVGINEDYSHLRPWGMDILKVGNSLGAGSLALLYKDSLYRVTSIDGATYTKVTEGPVRSILDLDFNDLIIRDVHLKLKHRISIVAGEYGYRSTVSTNNNIKDLFLVTGLVNMHSTTLYFDSSDKNEIMFTHDLQSENNDRLGLGIIVNINDYKGFLEAPEDISGNEIVNSYCMKLRTTTESKTNFRVYACWQMTDATFKYRMNFRSYLLKEAYKMDQPIIINYHSNSVNK